MAKRPAAEADLKAELRGIYDKLNVEERKTLLAALPPVVGDPATADAILEHCQVLEKARQEIADQIRFLKAEAERARTTDYDVEFEKLSGTLDLSMGRLSFAVSGSEGADVEKFRKYTRKGPVVIPESEAHFGFDPDDGLPFIPFGKKNHNYPAKARGPKPAEIEQEARDAISRYLAGERM